MTKPICEGKYIFSGIQEGSGEGLREIVFNPPLVIEYSIWEKIDKETGKENYPEESPIMGYIDFDFGMDAKIALDVKYNWLVDEYNGLTVESPLQDKLMKSIFFDLFHAFYHPNVDPNYSHYHHALFAYLNPRVTLKEND